MAAINFRIIPPVKNRFVPAFNVIEF